MRQTFSNSNKNDFIKHSPENNQSFDFCAISPLHLSLTLSIPHTTHRVFIKTLFFCTQRDTDRSSFSFFHSFFGKGEE